MRIRWENHTGWPSRQGLAGRISAFSRWDRCTRFKIGITGDPERRARQYLDDYDEMVVLYETPSQKHVRDTERHLTEYYWDYCDNSIKGGNGRLSDPPFYLYVVLCHW